MPASKKVVDPHRRSMQLNASLTSYTISSLMYLGKMDL